MKSVSTSKGKKTTKQTQQTFVQGELFSNLEEVVFAKPKKEVEKDPFADFWEPEIFPLEPVKERVFTTPIETRVYNNVQVNSYRTKAGVKVLSVMGQDGVMMSVPGSFDDAYVPEAEEKTIVTSVTIPFEEKKTVSVSAPSLMNKVDAFQSQIKEPKKNNLSKAPYNLADVPPLVYGTPRKEGVNLLRIFRGK